MKDRMFPSSRGWHSQVVFAGIKLMHKVWNQKFFFMWTWWIQKLWRTNMGWAIILQVYGYNFLILDNLVVLVQESHIKWCILPGFRLMIINNSKSFIDIRNMLQSSWTSTFCDNLSATCLTWSAYSKRDYDFIFALLDTPIIQIGCAIRLWWCCAML